jgi:hypothetical protein
MAHSLTYTSIQYDISPLPIDVWCAPPGLVSSVAAPLRGMGGRFMATTRPSPSTTAASLAMLQTPMVALCPFRAMSAAAPSRGELLIAVGPTCANQMCLSVRTSGCCGNPLGVMILLQHHNIQWQYSGGGGRCLQLRGIDRPGLQRV